MASRDGVGATTPAWCRVMSTLTLSGHMPAFLATMKKTHGLSRPQASLICCLLCACPDSTPTGSPPPVQRFKLFGKIRNLTTPPNSTVSSICRRSVVLSVGMCSTDAVAQAANSSHAVAATIATCQHGNGKRIILQAVMLFCCCEQKQQIVI